MKLDGAQCGENRHLGGSNIVEFYITSKNCSIKLVRRESITSVIWLKEKLRNFIANGYTNAFELRISSQLAIESEQVKVVSLLAYQR